MIALISDNLDPIAALCREFHIRKLDLFGSAATGAFDPETSDVDFVVDLGEYRTCLIPDFTTGKLDVFGAEPPASNNIAGTELDARTTRAALKFQRSKRDA